MQTSQEECDEDRRNARIRFILFIIDTNDYMCTAAELNNDLDFISFILRVALFIRK